MMNTLNKIIQSFRKFWNDEPSEDNGLDKYGRKKGYHPKLHYDKGRDTIYIKNEELFESQAFKDMLPKLRQFQIDHDKYWAYQKEKERLKKLDENRRNKLDNLLNDE